MLFLFSGGDSRPFCWILAELSLNYCPHSEEGKEERLLQNNGLTLSPKSRDSQTKPRLFASRLCLTKAKYFLLKFIKKYFIKLLPSREQFSENFKQPANAKPIEPATRTSRAIRRPLRHGLHGLDSNSLKGQPHV